MKVVFAGTPVFALRALQALVAGGHEVVLVLTRPDKPAQRGQRLSPSPVKQWALEQGLALWQPPTLRDPGTWSRLAQAGADVMVVAAYGLLLPPEVLTLPRYGCLNIHASLLPRWRGAAPIQRAIEAGDTQTGITIMQMDAGLDTGAIRWVRALPIGPEDTGGQVHDALAALGAEAIVEALGHLTRGTLPSAPQPTEGVTYASKLTRADGSLDWTRCARAIVDRIRAFDPTPGCTTLLARRADAMLKVWRAGVAESRAAGALPGTVLEVADGAITVACGDGTEAVSLTALQRPGGRRMAVRDFVAGFPVQVGDRFVGAVLDGPA